MPGMQAVTAPPPIGVSNGRPLRVAYAIDSLMDSGGTELHAVRLAEHMARAGTSVTLVTLNADGPMRARYAAAGIEIHAFPVSSLVGPSAIRQVRSMAAFFRAGTFDVVHAHDCYTDFLATMAGRLAGVPLVIASKRWTRNLYPQHAWTNRLAFRAAHLVVANSKTVADTVHRDEWVARSRIHVTPNFLDEASFELPSGEARRALRASLGYGDEHVVFAILAQLRAEKDHWLLLRAFGQVVREHSSARLVIIGDGPERGRIEAHIAAASLGAFVHMTRHAALPRPLLAAADVCVLSSQHEGFPNALMEGMAVGRPVVATAAGGVQDAVRDGETGLLSPVGDHDGLAGNMMRIASDETLRRRLGAAARCDMQARFSASIAIDALRSLYLRNLPEAYR
jgi:glycosyltransferase involved in cell wall biosynthesis